MAEITQSYRISQLTTGKVGEDKMSQLLSGTIKELTADDLAGLEIFKIDLSGLDNLKKIELPESFKYLHTGQLPHSLDEFKFSSDLEVFVDTFKGCKKVDYNLQNIPIVFNEYLELINYENCPFAITRGSYRSDIMCGGDSSDSLTIPLYTVLPDDIRFSSLNISGAIYYKIPEGVTSFTFTGANYSEDFRIEFPETLEYLNIDADYGTNGLTSQIYFFQSTNSILNLKINNKPYMNQTFTPLSLFCGEIYRYYNGTKLSVKNFSKIDKIPNSPAPYPGLLTAFTNLEEIEVPAYDFASILVYFRTDFERENTAYEQICMKLPNGENNWSSAYVPTQLSKILIYAGKIGEYTLSGLSRLSQLTISEDVEEIWGNLYSLGETCTKIYTGTGASLKSKLSSERFDFPGTIICSDGEYTAEQLNNL